MSHSKIVKEMTIEEIFSKFPEKSQKLAQEMNNRGLSCVGCQAATYETLEAGVLGHGYGEEDLEALLTRLNAILEEEVSSDTISMTKRAVEKFLALLKEEGKEGWSLRFGDQPGGCGGFEYLLDFSKEAKEDDEVFHCEGVDIHVEKASVSRLLGSEIDYLDGLQGSGFKVSNPNVKGSCSCGQSQSY